MKLSKQLATNLRAIFIDKNWVSVNLKTALADVDYHQANHKVGTLNSIVAIVYHMHYYINGIIDVLEGKPLAIRDKFSFDHPTITSNESWNQMIETVMLDVEKIALLIEAIPDEDLENDFDDGKYGSTYRNINGLIEHSYYHLGQIPIIKKLTQESI